MSTPDEIILMTQPGPVIRVGGICYEFVEEITQPPTSSSGFGYDGSYDGVYEDCATCQGSSSSSSGISPQQVSAEGSSQQGSAEGSEAGSAEGSEAGSAEGSAQQGSAEGSAQQGSAEGSAQQGSTTDGTGSTTDGTGSTTDGTGSTIGVLGTLPSSNSLSTRPVWGAYCSQNDDPCVIFGPAIICETTLPETGSWVIGAPPCPGFVHAPEDHYAYFIGSTPTSLPGCCDIPFCACPVSSSSGDVVSPVGSSSSSSGDVVSPVLFLHMDGTDGSQLFIDSAKGKVIIPHGHVHIDTARRVAGTASGYFDGSLDYLTFGSSDEDFVFSGDFTISCWVMLGQALPAAQSVFGISFTVLKLLIEDRGQAIRLFTNGASTAGAVSMLVDNWYNLSVVRSGNTITVYMGGSPILTRTDGSVINASKIPMAIGTYGYTGGGQYFLGWLDEFSIIHKAGLH